MNGPLSSPATAASLVEYQDGSVVSRVLAKAAGGNVTVFAFDRGQQLSEHTTPYEALLQVVDGRAFVTIAGTEHELEQGQMIRLPPNVPHAVHAKQRFKMLLVMVK